MSKSKLWFVASYVSLLPRQQEQLATNWVGIIACKSYHEIVNKIIAVSASYLLHSIGYFPFMIIKYVNIKTYVLQAYAEPGA